MKNNIQVETRFPRLQISFFPRALAIVLLLAVPFLTSCGGGGSSAAPPPPPPPPPPVSAVSVTISPKNVDNLPAGGTQTFRASVTGSNNQTVTWSVQEGAVGGSITSGGVYTAPQTPGTYHVVATSQADNTKSDTATVTVNPVSVSIQPAQDILGPGGVRTFMAFVTGTMNTPVVWSVQEGAVGGTITSLGVYTAPTTLGTFHVIATSVADPSQSATAVVTVVASGFRPTGGMATAREGHTATILTDERVLVAGGYAVANAELFDPTTQTFAATGKMNSERDGHTATALPNGKVLVAGGVARSTASVLQTAELYDPVTGTFAATGSMATARAGHTATLLPNGKVLVAGGYNDASAELYDPATGAFTSTGNMSISRLGHTATLLPNGKVLIAGGQTEAPGVGSSISFTAELYDPASVSFALTGNLSNARFGHTATLLKNGEVLVAGGVASFATPPFLTVTAELYNPAGGSFALAGSMSNARADHIAALLANGTVLVAGGNAVKVDVSFSAEVFDPVTGSFNPTGSMFTPRSLHTATLLTDGRVLVIGGDDGNGCNSPDSCGISPLASAELYK
jgi:hypothetical protein